MKNFKVIITIGLLMTFTINTYAAMVPRESAPCYATEEQIVVVDRLVGSVFDKVQSGMGYSDAMAESNYIIFNAWLAGQTDGYSFGELAPIANNAIFQYRDMYLRPDFYTNNVEKVRGIIAPVVEEYKKGKIDYNKACFDARVKIYQSINPSFNPDVEYAKDSCYRDIPSVDSSLFRIARKLLRE